MLGFIKCKIQKQMKPKDKNWDDSVWIANVMGRKKNGGLLVFLWKNQAGLTINVGGGRSGVWGGGRRGEHHSLAKHCAHLLVHGVAFQEEVVQVGHGAHGVIHVRWGGRGQARVSVQLDFCKKNHKNFNNLNISFNRDRKLMSRSSVSNSKCFKSNSSPETRRWIFVLSAKIMS